METQVGVFEIVREGSADVCLSKGRIALTVLCRRAHVHAVGGAGGCGEAAGSINGVDEVVVAAAGNFHEGVAAVYCDGCRRDIWLFVYSVVFDFIAVGPFHLAGVASAGEFRLGGAFKTQVILTEQAVGSIIPHFIHAGGCQQCYCGRSQCFVQILHDADGLRISRSS